MASTTGTIGAGALVNGRVLAETAVTTNADEFYSAPPTMTLTGGAAEDINNSSPTISGTTDVGTSGVVTVTVAGQTLTTTPALDGSWSVTPAILANGTYPVAGLDRRRRGEYRQRQPAADHRHRPAAHHPRRRTDGAQHQRHPGHLRDDRCGARDHHHRRGRSSDADGGRQRYDHHRERRRADAFGRGAAQRYVERLSRGPPGRGSPHGHRLGHRPGRQHQHRHRAAGRRDRHARRSRPPRRSRRPGRSDTHEPDSGPPRRRSRPRPRRRPRR